MFYQWAPYVPVAQRRRNAAAQMAKLAKKGQVISPVQIVGRAIATTVWGNAWCANLENYSDYSNRLPRGRTYVRNGSVVDLQITPGTVAARVSGSSMYRITITVKPLAAAAWKAMCADCSGGIDSLVELLEGRFATGVMERLCRQGDGFFPVPKDIRFDCSCPDGAYMCKHVAAVLYGVGARFDHQPELLFTLRQVDASALLAKAGAGLAAAGTTSQRALVTDDVGALFDLEMDGGQPAAEQPVVAASSRSTSTKADAIRLAAKKTPGRAKRGDPVNVLLETMRTHGPLDNAAARTVTGLDASAVRLLLQNLVSDGRVRTLGRKRGTRYVAVDQFAAAAAARPAVRAKPGDPANTLLLALRRHGSLDNPTARALTGLDATAVRLLLQSLVSEGHARVEGRKRGTRYLVLKKASMATAATASPSVAGRKNRSRS
jgi:uncharacterized Zn finger protein